MGNISFQTRNRKIYLTMLGNSYGSTGPNQDFWVPKGVKMTIFYNNVYKTPYDGTKPGLMGNISFQTRIRKIYLTIFQNRYGSTGPKRYFWVLKWVKMPIFYNNIYKTPYDGTKPCLMGNISFQTRNRKIYLTIFQNRYGSTGPKRSFWVLKGVKIPIFYNNVYKTPYDDTKPDLMGKISFQTRNRKIYLTMLGNSYGSTGPNQDFWV